jgi:hypothetical protein
MLCESAENIGQESSECGIKIRRGTQLIVSRYLAYHPQISEPTPVSVSVLLIILWVLNCQVFDTGFKANASIFYMKNRKIKIILIQR